MLVSNVSPDLKFVKNFTRPDVEVKNLHTLKKRQSRLFLITIKQHNFNINDFVLFLFKTK